VPAGLSGTPCKTKIGLKFVLNGSIESEVGDMIINVVGGVPCTTPAFCAEVPGFDIVLASGVRIFRWIFDPARNVFVVIGIVIDATMLMGEVRVIGLGH